MLPNTGGYLVVFWSTGLVAIPSRVGISSPNWPNTGKFMKWLANLITHKPEWQVSSLDRRFKDRVRVRARASGPPVVPKNRIEDDIN